VALIICDTGPGTRNPSTREAWNEQARQRAASLRSIGVEALSTSPEVDLVRRDHQSVEGLAKAALGMVLQDHEGVLGQLDRIAAPALVIVGENDEPFLNGIDYIASHISGAEKVVIPGAGHSSNIDNPAAFNAAVVQFLARLDVAV
jgi:pimeloyl-ACP methyl ester carboxylesterase